MDLSHQPPRRPSNVSIAGIVGLARMADKARAHQEDRLGEFVYGDNSGLDREVLEFIRMDAESFARAAAEQTDEDLAETVRQGAARRADEVEAFNRERVERVPQDDRHRQLLRERVARYAPDRADITTVFASIELDDWGSFRELDLTAAPPRSPYLRTVAGIAGAARMADKARARTAGKLGAYKYGVDSGIDDRILQFLGVDGDDFARAAWENPNDDELGDWVRQHTTRTAAQISSFNAMICALGRYQPARERLLQRRTELGGQPGEVECFFDLLDLDDQQSFGLVDLTRRPPRSPYDTSVGGVTGLARLIDKGRARNGATLGLYWYGEDSGVDRGLLAFLGVNAADFGAALRAHTTDEAVVSWLGERLAKPAAELQAYNDATPNLGPDTPEQRVWLQAQVSRLDPTRRDITTWFAWMLLDDVITFARLHAGV
jgi:hypothetical protein